MAQQPKSTMESGLLIAKGEVRTDRIVFLDKACQAVLVICPDGLVIQRGEIRKP